MTRTLAITLSALAVVAMAVPAQTQATSSSTAGAVISVQGGGFTSAVNLNDAKTADFKTGFNAGGAIGYQLNDIVGLRGTFTFARTESEGAGLPTLLKAGTKANRFFYGGEVVLKAPLTGGISPYVLVGGGAMTFKPDTTPSQDSFTKPAGKVGVGVNIDIPKSNVSVFAEGGGWFYQFDQFGFDKTQFDLTWSAGLSYRFGR